MISNHILQLRIKIAIYVVLVATLCHSSLISTNFMIHGTNLSIDGIDKTQVPDNDTRNHLALTMIPKDIILKEPFFVESYSNSTVEPQPANTSFTTRASGTGLFNGNLKVDTDANATIIFRDSETMFLEGRANYFTDKGDKASYEFLELGKINSTDLTYSGGGIAIYGQEATGELSSLSNVVAVYKSYIDTEGNATVLYYHWN